ncbi:PilZ domain-containing protein [Guyparkeria hydrothermalis]|uniref:PilZ domain-containing protein n=1 Tax=Guyparkeria hydrothermalis TaxID=923 RepID=UPI00202026D8|nr:PilZ domain-containing protein [Guyparkeria hydrothermalis]MCL7744034.1 PilZ domain-containing protein [Guyparkeria hydrothermalis]
MITQRRFARVEIPLPVRIRCPGETLRGTILDVSLKGILIELEAPGPISDDCVADPLDVQILSDPDQTVLVELNARVIREDDRTLALAWSTIELDELTHLRELLQYNGVEEHQLSRELSELLDD